MYELTVDCACKHTIRLPLTKPPQRVLDQLKLAPGGLPANVLCPHCKQASAYSPHSFRRKFFEKTPLDQLRGDQVCVCIQTGCGLEGCASLVNMYTAMTISEDMHDGALELLDGAMLVGAVCGKGHPLNRRVLSGAYAVFAHPGWGPQDLNSLASDTPPQ